MKIGLKIALALGLIVLVVTGILTYVTLNNVRKLGQRIESFYADAVVPYAQAEALDNSLDGMEKALLNAINETGSEQQLHINEIGQREQEFTNLFDEYEQKFSSWGMVHDQAESGPQALELLKAAAAQGAAYDLVVLDLLMPGMDGFALAEAIKADPNISRARLVLLTSAGEREDGARSRAAGISAYLSKPVRQSQLFDCLISVMSKSSAEGPPVLTLSTLITKHTLEERKTMSHKLILLAEDNIVNQKVAIRQLQKLGYRCDAVANGREAIEALSRIPYDLVLMDCQMPEMDGYEVTEEIRGREGVTKHTPVVAMTAHALEGDREKCIAAGMDDYITKPVRPEALKDVLDRFLSSSIADAADTETAAADSSPVDMERLREALGDDPESVSEILTLYLDDMSTGLDRMEIALQSSDHAEIELIAHN